jgi:excisionase family DNA binding protein
MKNQTISFNDIPAVLESIMDKQNEILKALEKQPEQSQGKEVLTYNEACEFLGVTRPTLWRWEKTGKVKSYGIEGKRFYKRTELMEALIPLND